VTAQTGWKPVPQLKNRQSLTTFPSEPPKLGAPSHQNFGGSQEWEAVDFCPTPSPSSVEVIRVSRPSRVFCATEGIRPLFCEGVKKGFAGGGGVVASVSPSPCTFKIATIKRQRCGVGIYGCGGRLSFGHTPKGMKKSRSNRAAWRAR